MSTRPPEREPDPHGPDDPARDDDAARVSRRRFMQSAGLSAAAAAAPAVARHTEAGLREGLREPETLGPGPARLPLRVNGERVDVTAEPSTTLLEALRHEADRTGAKQICDRGACGGCTVMVDGAVVASCMMLACDAQGREVTTVEGLRDDDGTLSALQESFIRHDALQCGYCTPGFLVAAAALLRANPRPTLDEIKSGLAGNICRCGTYTNVFNAVLEASGQPVIRDGEG